MILFVYQISFSFPNLIIEFDFYQIDTIGRTNITKWTNLLKWVNRCKNINQVIFYLWVWIAKHQHSQVSQISWKKYMNNNYYLLSILLSIYKTELHNFWTRKTQQRIAQFDLCLICGIRLGPEKNVTGRKFVKFWGKFEINRKLI